MCVSEECVHVRLQRMHSEYMYMHGHARMRVCAYIRGQVNRVRMEGAQGRLEGCKCFTNMCLYKAG